MSLSADLISQFTKVTKQEPSTKKESTVYGTIVKYGDDFYARIDGSDILTPITSAVDVKDGDRVSMLIKNHSATVTGNFSAPSVNEDSHIFKGLVTFQGLSGGTTTIDGACIKTGTINADRIDAKNLCLTGSINIGPENADYGNFVVDTDGNVTMKGDILIAGNLEMTGETSFILARYSTDKTASIPDGWSESWNSAWDNTSTEVWGIYSYNRGATWSTPVLVQGKTGDKGDTGAPGSDANVPAWVRAYTSSAEYNTLVTNEWVVTMNLFASQIYGSAYYDTNGLMKMQLAYHNAVPCFQLTDMEYNKNICMIWSTGNEANLDLGGAAWSADLTTPYYHYGYAYANIDAWGQHTFNHKVVFASGCEVVFDGATVSGMSVVFG